MLGEWLFPVMHSLGGIGDPAKVSDARPHNRPSTSHRRPCRTQPPPHPPPPPSAGDGDAPRARGGTARRPSPRPPEPLRRRDASPGRPHRRPHAAAAGGRRQNPRRPPPAARPPATREPRPPQAPHALAKTKLCTNWIQRGYCRNGDACNFAHGTTDMTQNAQEIKKSKVSREKVSASFLPLQAMVRAPSTKLAAPKPPPANPVFEKRPASDVVPSAAAVAANEAAAEKLTLATSSSRRPKRRPPPPPTPPPPPPPPPPRSTRSTPR